MMNDGGLVRITLCPHAQDNNALLWAGRLLPFVVMVSFPLYGEGKQTIAIAFGVLGQLALNTTIQQRSVRRKAIKFLFKDILDLFAGLGNTELTPSEKLELLTPGRLTCELTCHTLGDGRVSHPLHACLPRRLLPACRPPKS